MGRIPRDIVDAVRDRTDIIEVIGRHVTLRKAGNSLTGLCPFHQEKSPSFHVIPAKGIFHCFGCQAGGDVFKFLMTLEGLSFVECVKELAGPAGVDIPERELTVDEQRALRARATLFDVLEEAAQFWESTLWTHPDGQPGRDYLRKRQLSDVIARQARLGFAPENWTRLLDHLHRKGFPAERVLEAGLARARTSGGLYDVFRDRLMFPIRDERSRVIGFGGRILDGDGPRYINTPETKLYDKSRVLYGLETARSAIQRNDRAIVVEGYFDVLAMQEAGFSETVATCGTAMTKDHTERIRRITHNVLLLTDGDNAGQAAAERALPILLDAGLHGYRVDLPGAKDPDEFVRAHGAQALATCLERRESLVEWVVRRKLLAYADRTALGAEITSQARDRVLTDLQPLLARLPGPLIHKIAARLGVREEVVHERMAAAPRPQEVIQAAPRPTGWKAHRDMTHVFWLLVHAYDSVADLLQRVDPSIFADHPETHEAVARLLTGEPVASVIAEAADEGVRRALQAVVARQGLYEPEQAGRALCDVLFRLVRPRLVAERTSHTSAMEDALRTGDTDGRRAALQGIQELAAVERALQTTLSKGDLDGFIRALTGCLQTKAPRA